MTESNVIDFPQRLADQAEQPHVFSFGDPEPVLTTNPTHYLGAFLDVNGEYYRPPMDWQGVADLIGANAYHGPILHFKKDMILKWYVPSARLNYVEMKKAALDYQVFGNCYFKRIYNRLGGVVRLERLPALVMRRGKKTGQFFQVKRQYLYDDSTNIVEFAPDEVIHLKEPDVKQDIYGMPQYLGGIQTVLLSEDSTLFRRKYYKNGAHMGYILVTNDCRLKEETVMQIEKKIADSKGPGNFRCLYLNIPNSSAREPVQVVPVGNIGTKDEFQRIKDVTQEEMLAMHRMRPELMGIIPQNAGGFADPEKTMRVYHELEVEAMQQVFLELNDLAGSGTVAFREPTWTGATT